MDTADDPAGSDGPALESSLPESGSAPGVGPSRPADFPDPVDDPDARGAKYARISQTRAEAQVQDEFSTFVVGDETFYHNAEDAVPSELWGTEHGGAEGSAESWEPETLEVPEALKRPLSSEEPLPADELAHLDSLAGDFEVQRLLAMGVMSEAASDRNLADYRSLSTKFVCFWRQKQGSWIRRARLVARDFAFLDPL